MKVLTRAACLALGMLWIGAAAAQAPPASTPSKPLSTSLGLVVFPAKGQKPDKQAADEGECFSWSKSQTGIDPFAAASAPAAQQPSQPSGARARGAARGAAAGAVIGGVAGDAGKGAAVGATAGTLKGGSETRRAQKESEQEAANKAQQEQAEQRAMFNKGFSACMEARGYTVK